jgi:cation diffusion facilitator CzcD-associated flavoprotein CzcO
MKACQLTPTPTDVDIDALRVRYRQERDKRLRKDGSQQYVDPARDIPELEADPHTPPVPRDPINEDIEILIIGGGFSGLMAGARLTEQGVTDFKIVDYAGDFGGVWYWNRYPGIQCDNEAYTYLLLLEETGYVPKSKFADGREIHAHCQRIGRHFNLYDKAIFSTNIDSLQWDETIKRWRVATNRGDDIRARFVINCLGSTNHPKLPGVPGIKDFKGKAFHSARWDFDYTGGDAFGGLDKLRDKKVAIIGTGASAIQIIPYVGQYAEQLYVFQRTPSYVDHRGNLPTDQDWAKSLQAGWQKERQKNFHEWGYDFFPPGDWRGDAVCDFWTEINRNIAMEMEQLGWPQLTPEEAGAMREKWDFHVTERLRQRTASIVKDPKTAESLKPFYSFNCKRPCSNDDYLQTFNLPNVTLVDVADRQGVDRITEKGIVANGQEYEVDLIIFASGFEVTGDLKKRYVMNPFVGRNGVSFFDYWGDGFRTLHGMTVHNFPNLFFTGFTQAAAGGNITAMMDQQVSHIAWILKEAKARGATVLEPTAEAEAAWVQHVADTKVDKTEFLLACTPGYWNGEGGGAGSHDERAKKIRWIFGDDYGPGFYAFEQLLEEWRSKGDMEGLVLETDKAAQPA